MPEEKITIGGRDFDVACQPGEETFLRAAARMLDIEASTLAERTGRLPEGRMLLMAGLMLADRTAALEAQVGELQAEVEQLRAAPPPEPHRIEVPVMPSGVIEALSELAARSEALADAVEAKAAG